MFDLLFVALAIGWFVQAATAGQIAHHRGGSAFGYMLAGLLIGPFALLLAYDFGGQVCVYCQSRIHWEAARCPRCQGTLREMKTSPVAQEGARVCDSCGGWVRGGALECPKCQAELKNP